MLREPDVELGDLPTMSFTTTREVQHGNHTFLCPIATTYKPYYVSWLKACTNVRQRFLTKPKLATDKNRNPTLVLPNRDVHNSGSVVHSSFANILKSVQRRLPSVVGYQSLLCGPAAPTAAATKDNNWGWHSTCLAGSSQRYSDAESVVWCGRAMHHWTAVSLIVPRWCMQTVVVSRELFLVPNTKHILMLNWNLLIFLLILFWIINNLLNYYCFSGLPILFLVLKYNT